MPISRPRPIPDSSKNISTPREPVKKVEKRVDPWGAYQKIEMKNILGKIKDRDVYNKTGISRLRGKQILEKTLGTSYVQKSAFKKAMQGLTTKSRHAPTGKERTEALKELNYLREIKKSLEPK